MKKILLIVICLFLMSGLAGCEAIETSKKISELDRLAFSYEFSTDCMEDLDYDSKAMRKWGSKVAKRIKNGELEEIKIRAFISNMERAEYKNEEILRELKEYYSVKSYEDRIKNGENLIEILEEFDKEYHAFDENEYYNLFDRQLDIGIVVAAAEKQLKKCNLENGYYDIEENKFENKKSDGIISKNDSKNALLEKHWYWKYRGDFCSETLQSYHGIYGHFISDEFKGLYYMDTALSASEDLADDVMRADAVYIDEKTGKILVHGDGLSSNFFRCDIEA